MQHQPQSDAVQRAMARRLVALLGRRAAIDVCRTNFWFGIAKLIEATYAR